MVIDRVTGLAEAADVVGPALGKGSYPWYDSGSDQAKPINLFRQANWNWNLSIPWLGNLVAILLFAVGLVALIGLLIWFWKLYEPIDSTASTDRPGRDGEPARVETLPPGMRREFDSADPWEEALRRRDRGDLAGAVICLFAHQLLTLSRLGLIRLAPGKTGRQLLRSVADPSFRPLVDPTLRLFESTYYGHRTPSAAEFAEVWEHAEAFERRATVGRVA